MPQPVTCRSSLFPETRILPNLLHLPTDIASQQRFPIPVREHQIRPLPELAPSLELFQQEQGLLGEGNTSVLVTLRGLSPNNDPSFLELDILPAEYKKLPETHPGNRSQVNEDLVEPRSFLNQLLDLIPG